MSLDVAILGLLGERPRTGYDLKTRCFDDLINPFWTADQAQIYRTLDRLRASGHVTVSTRRQQGRPDRRIYAITSSGRAFLATWLATPRREPAARDPFLLQLYFAASLADTDVLGVLSAKHDEHAKRLDALVLAASELEDAQLAPRTMVLRQTALDGAAERERAVIAWLNDCIAAVETGALPGPDSSGIGQRQQLGAAPA